MNKYTMAIWWKIGVCTKEKWVFTIITDYSAEFVTNLIQTTAKRLKFSNPEKLMDYICKTYDVQCEKTKYDIEIELTFAHDDVIFGNL